MLLDDMGYPVTDNAIVTPDRVVAGIYPPPVTEAGTILQYETSNVSAQEPYLLLRGTVLGQVSLGAVSVAASGGNVGQLSFGTIERLARCQPGTYLLECIEALGEAPADISLLSVTDPDGILLANAQVGIAYGVRIGFTAAAGASHCAVGDMWTVTVAAGAIDSNGVYYYRVCNSANTDGSQYACRICASRWVDTSAAAVEIAVYRQGEFAATFLIFGGTDTVGMHLDELSRANLLPRNAVGVMGGY